MAWGAGNELWVVNTHYSCFCTIDGSASVTPRWRPPFVSPLKPTDRGHLNGLAMADVRPRYVTAIGETDDPAGGRANKAKGGIVMDVASGEVITRGLSMPHSPRWYGGRLWVCESGAGTFGYIDPNSLNYVPIAEVPGFTGGLEFAGNFAFVGLSQVRESAVFSGIALTERLTEEQRNCGVCLIDLSNGQVVALVAVRGHRAGVRTGRQRHRGYWRLRVEWVHHRRQVGKRPVNRRIHSFLGPACRDGHRQQSEPTGGGGPGHLHATGQWRLDHAERQPGDDRIERHCVRRRDAQQRRR